MNVYCTIKIKNTTKTKQNNNGLRFHAETQDRRPGDVDPTWIRIQEGKIEKISSNFHSINFFCKFAQALLFFNFELPESFMGLNYSWIRIRI